MIRNYKLWLLFLIIGFFNISCAKDPQSFETRLVTSQELLLKEWGCTFIEVSEDPFQHELNCDYEKYAERLSKVDYDSQPEEAAYFGELKEGVLVNYSEDLNFSRIALYWNSVNRLSHYFDEFVEIAKTETYQGETISVFQSNNILSKAQALMTFESRTLNKINTLVIEQRIRLSKKY
jgi:hypothetical protein